jgi:hypothetical protein
MVDIVRAICSGKSKAAAYGFVVIFCYLSISSADNSYSYIAREQWKTPVDQSRPKVLDALSDFQFVGSVAKDVSLDRQLSIRAQDLPLKFEVGRQYVWLKRGYANNQEIFKSLQARLNSMGVTVLDAVGNANRFIGGLSFRISFKEGNYKGTLFNALDSRIVKGKKLQKQWSFDDYVVVFEEVP